uniref:T-cell receptor alpha/delta variable 11.0.3 n=1 Tax=Sinocyclocheilus anshuiensis TaxID=1608454 RepID=A0A671QAF2_9TELE
MASLLYLLVILAIQGKSFAQSIAPLQSTEHATERETVILSYKYDGQARSLHWYRQYPGSRPEFLLLVCESNSLLHAEPPFPRMNASVNKVEKQVHLEISSAAVTDSALYYCSLESTNYERAHSLG